MQYALAFCPQDQNQALALAQWLSELGGAKTHDLLLIADSRCNPKEVQECFAKSFNSVELLSFVDHYNRWPNSANECFALAARHIYETRKQPWCWIEPDLVVLKAGALDEFAEEYKAALAAGKKYLGDFVSDNNSGLKDHVVPHMSGCGWYSADPYDAGNALMGGDTAFDILGSDQIVPQMATSQLLLHRWKHPAFETWQQVEERIFAVKPKAVLFHADKTGSLYPLLRQKLKGGDVKCAAPVEIITPADSMQNRSAPSIQQPSDAAPRSEPERAAETASTSTTSVVSNWPAQIPWANREESIAEIKRLAARLKAFQGSSSPKVRFVRELLQKQGVIELPYRNKRRKGWKKKRK